MSLFTSKSADRTERFRIFTGGVSSGKTLSMIVSALELSKKTKLDIVHETEGIVLDKDSCILLLSGLIMKGTSEEVSDFNRKYFTDYLGRLEETNTYLFIEVQDSLTLVPQIERFVGFSNRCSLDITQRSSNIKMASYNLISGAFSLLFAEVAIVVQDSTLNSIYKEGGVLPYKVVTDKNLKSLVI